MKILSIVSSGYEQGGVETTVVSYNQILRNKGHDARILSSNVRPDLSHYSDYEFLAIPNNGIKKLINQAFNISAYKVAKRVLKEFKPDVVVLHTMQQVTPSILLLLKKYSTIQCVHGPEAFTTSLLEWHINSNSFKNNNYDLKNLTVLGKVRYLCLKYPYNLFYKISFKNVDRFLVFSSYTKQLLLKDGFGQRVSYMPSGVKLFNVTKKNNHRKVPIIGYAGRIESYKGIIDLLDAMPSILSCKPTTRLIIAGEGSYLKELQQHVSKIGIDKSVSFIGRLGRQGMEEFYNDLSVLVMPSIWPETFGKVGVEAMSVGVPVIATDVGGVKDWLKNSKNGFLIDPSSPDQIEKYVNKILGDRNLNIELSRNAKETAHNFSMEKFTDNLLKIAKEIINNP